jgi:hypothetical protein
VVLHVATVVLLVSSNFIPLNLESLYQKEPASLAQMAMALPAATRARVVVGASFACDDALARPLHALLDAVRGCASVEKQGVVRLAHMPNAARR